MSNPPKFRATSSYQSGAAHVEEQSASQPPILEEPTATPEDTLLAGGISSRRQARYQPRMSSLLAESVMASIVELRMGDRITDEYRRMGGRQPTVHDGRRQRPSQEGQQI